MNNQQKTVCHVIHSFDHVGGAENVIISLLNNLDSTSKHVVCSLTTIGQIKNRVNNKNVSYYALNKKEGNDPFLPYRLYKVFRKEKVSVVHLRGWATLLEGYIAAKLSRVSRIIYSEHGRHFEDVWHDKKLKIIVKRYLFSHVDRLMAVSSELKSELAKLYDIKRYITVIRNGVDSAKFKPGEKKRLRNRLGFDEYTPIIGIVGRLVPGKNVHEFIDKIPGYKVKAQIVVVGDGPLLEIIKQQIVTCQLENQVCLLGSRNDVADLLRVFDLLAMPSQSEGLSNVIIEAMSTGLPVVGFNVGGNKELIDSNLGGYLCELNDWDDLFCKISALVEDQNLIRQFGDYNRKKIVDSFTLTNMYGSYEKLYFGE